MDHTVDRAHRWLISGRVQGVGFRWFTRQQAERLGLSGWAENLPDGRVEIVARGAPDALDEFEEAIRQGPRFARVDDVEKADIPHEDVPDKSFKTR